MHCSQSDSPLIHFFGHCLLYYPHNNGPRRLLQLLFNETTPDDSKGIIRKPLTSALQWYPGCQLTIVIKWGITFAKIRSDIWAILKPRRFLPLLLIQKTPDDNQGINRKPLTSALWWYPSFNSTTVIECATKFETMWSNIWAIIKPRRLLQLLLNQTSPDDNQGICGQLWISVLYWYPSCHLTIVLWPGMKFAKMWSDIWAILKPPHLWRLLLHQKTPENNHGIFWKLSTRALDWYPSCYLSIFIQWVTTFAKIRSEIWVFLVTFFVLSVHRSHPFLPLPHYYVSVCLKVLGWLSGRLAGLEYYT